jgi:Zn-finger nucleic acid-binding protein
VIVDGCRECRGIFLDRSELERLVDAEGGAPRASAAPPWAGGQERGSRGFGDQLARPYRAEWPDDDHDDRDSWRERDRDERDRDDRGRRDPRGGWDAQPASRRRSILGSLLDGFGD